MDHSSPSTFLRTRGLSKLASVDPSEMPPLQLHTDSFVIKKTEKAKDIKKERKDRSISEWRTRDGFAVALYPYSSETEGHLSIKLGELVRLEEEFLPANSDSPTWFRGSLVASENSSENETGMFPANYCEIKDTDAADFIMNDLNQSLREWTEILKKMYMDRQTSGFEKLSERMTTLLDWHARMTAASTSETRKQELREKVLSKIEEGRKMMGLDVIVRTQSGAAATHLNTPMITLYRMYQETAADALKEHRKKKELDTFTSFLQKKDAPLVSAKEKSLINHLLVDLKIFMCSVGEPTELLFSLYNAQTKKFLTDDFLVLLTAQGMAVNMEKIGKLQTLFRDLSTRELNNPKLYLVCRVVRRGKMSLEEKKKEKKTVKNEFRRPFGCAVLQLESVIPKLSTSPTEFTMRVFSHTVENDFWQLHEMLISGNRGQFSEAPLSKGVCIALSLFNGDYNQVVQQNEQLKSITHTDKADFPEVFLPGFERHDIYLTLVEGDFAEKGKSIETSISLRNISCQQMTDCLTLGTGEKPISEHNGLIIKSTTHAKWNEKIKLKLTTEQLNQSHLWITNKICSEGKEKTIISHAFLFFVNRSDGAILPDEPKTLQCFKPFKIPTDKSYITDESKLSYRKGESIKVRLSIVSTSATQQPAMMALLRWNTAPNPNISKILNDFSYVEQVEIIKFLKQSFNSMFAILDKNTNDTNVALQVYNAIVRVVGVLVDERKTYASFKPVLDAYIRNQFSGALAHQQLITCLKHYFDSMNRTQLMPTLKCLDYILKFIIASRVVFNKTQSHSSLDTQFKKDLLDVFASFNKLMAIDKKEFIGAQSLALKKFSSLFQDLVQIFEVNELAVLVKNFVLSVKVEKEQKSVINMDKLYLVHKLVSSDLLLQEQSRSVLLPLIMETIATHLQSSFNDEVAESISIILAMLDLLSNKLKDRSSGLNYLLKVIPSLIGVISRLRKGFIQTSMTADALTAFLGVFHLLDTDQLVRFLALSNSQNQQGFAPSSPQGEEASSVDAGMLVAFLRELVGSRSYPENWFALILFQYSTLRNVLQALGTVLEPRVAALSPNRASDLKLVGDYLLSLLNFVRSPALALEAFNETKQTMLKETMGDCRVEMLKFFNKTWTQLGPRQSLFLSLVVDPAIELILIPNTLIRSEGFALYSSLFRREYEQSRSLQVITIKTGETLDKLVNEQRYTPEFSKAFFEQMEKSLTASDPGLKKLGTEFLSDAKKNTELSVAFQKLSEGSPDFFVTKSLLLGKMMEHHRSRGRTEAWVKYLLVLADHERSAKNMGEAATLITEYAHTLDWNNPTILPAVGDLPSESHTARRERLTKLAITEFDKANEWELALQLTSELVSRYQDVTYEYIKLAQILRLEAELFRKMTTQERFEDSYFYVGLWGQGFGTLLANTQYIFRGKALERLAEFQGTLQGMFPLATLLPYTEKPAASVQTAPGQSLQIFTVKISSPEEQRGEPSKIDPKLPLRVRKFQQEHNIRVFVYGRPFRKNKDKPKTPEAEFLDLWVSNTFFTVQHALPGPTRYTEIVASTESFISPVENAVNSIRGKNEELTSSIEKYKAGKETNYSPLSMLLKGVIDAAVNGGTRNYHLFQQPAYVKENPQDAETVKQLADALSLQKKILAQGLDLHGKNNPGELHKLLEIQFQGMK